MTAERWRAYWADKVTPQYARDDEEHYREYARELRLLFDDPVPTRVLDVGCGNGALYRHLGFDTCERYVGVDFSERMLGVFHAAFPDVEPVHADGASYRSDEWFDLIFSSQVAQYWRRRDLAEHLDNAVAMLAAGGSIVISGIPWSRTRLAYARGEARGRLGRWYDFPDVDRLATARGLRVHHYGSIHYPYRFHAVLRRAR